MTFENDYLRFDVPGLVDSPGQAISVDPLPARHFSPGVFAFGLNGPVVGIDVGGGIYSLVVPGAAGDVITNQREDSHWCDALIETVATQSAIAHGGDPEADRWFWHQNRSYSRSVLSGKPGFASPILWNAVEPWGYSTFNLSIQAHVEDDPWVPDRFPVLSRLRFIGGRTLEVTQAWMNHSFFRMPGSAGEASATWLDYFNFPWTVMRNSSFPQSVLGFVDHRTNINSLNWTDHNRFYGVTWFGKFSATTGVGVVIPPGAAVNAGRVMKAGIVEDGKTKAPWTFAATDQFIFCPAYGATLKRGQIAVARWYMGIGRSADAIAGFAAAPPIAPSFGIIDIPQSNDPAYKVGFARGPSGRLRPVALSSAEAILSSRWGTGMLPVYEISDNGAWRYTTDPYCGVRGKSYLINASRSVQRVIGFLYANPAGLAARGVPTGLIACDTSDVGYTLAA